VACPVEVREVFNFLITVSAAKAVLVHNHPRKPLFLDDDQWLVNDDP
jgi:DNA repair protein RadC